MGFLPQLWPVLNTVNIILMKEGENVDKLKDYVWYHELINRHLRLTTYIVVAFFAYWVTFPHCVNDIDLSNLFIYWMPIILIRDCGITYFFYGFWHWLLYDSQYAHKMKPKKFNPVFPDWSQWSHDRFWTFMGTLISSFFEVFILYLMVTSLSQHGNVFFEKESFWKYGINSSFWMLVIPYWRDFHFYWIHRVMHPWFNYKGKDKRQWDFGSILYKYVHSLHHQSYNTGPWSGLSMHPIEHIIYYSCTLLPFFVMYFIGLPQHAMHFLFNKFHATISPLPGHDGFDEPGGGSYFHYLHHSHFQCNYGTPMVPFDKLFGTFEDGSKYRKMKKFDSAKQFIQHG